MNVVGIYSHQLDISSSTATRTSISASGMMGVFLDLNLQYRTCGWILTFTHNSFSALDVYLNGWMG